MKNVVLTVFVMTFAFGAVPGLAGLMQSCGRLMVWTVRALVWNFTGVRI